TAARLRNPACRSPPGDPCRGAGAMLEPDTFLGYGQSDRGWLRSWGGLDRLGRGPEDWRADSRLAAPRGGERRRRRAARPGFRPEGERLQRGGDAGSA